MKKIRVILAVLLSLAFAFSAFACKPSEEDPKEPQKTVADLYEEGTVLRMACGYNSAKTGIAFDASTAGEGIVLNGTTYNTGDLKPTWVELQKILKVVFEDHYQGNSSAEKEFEYWKEQLDQVDMVAGSASKLSEYGTKGALVNIAEYLDLMPNFKAYLDANPIVRLSITGDTDNGAIYFSPYFDGVNDIERMPLMRTDWVVKLLDGEGEFTAEASKSLAEASYTAFITINPGTVEVVNADTLKAETITKDTAKYGNIVTKINEKIAADGSVSGVEMVNMLRDYIDDTYNNYYGTARSNLFVGQAAAYDVDELVALLRCVCYNPQTLNGTDTVQGIFSREDNNNQRNVDMFRFAGTLFGVRGMESRKDYLYVGTDGQLHDARMEEATYVALEKMNAMVNEGLISTAFVNAENVQTKQYLKDDLGFMHYDYSQTQTIFNEQDGIFDEGEEYRAVMIPLSIWYDGTNEAGVYMRFTESWRSVKTDGWGISAAGVVGNDNKLYAALALIDYAYSEKGQILMSYGPDEFIKTNADGSYVTFNFNGKQMPEIADSTRELLWSLAGGNYTNFARYYLGSTLSFVKSQAFELQCTTEAGRKGSMILSNAIAAGTIKHPILDLTDNPWYTSVATVLPFTNTENEAISGYTELASKGKFSQSKGESNLFVEIIRHGYSGDGTSSRAEVLETVTNTWNAKLNLQYQNRAWARIKTFYEGLEK